MVATDDRPVKHGSRRIDRDLPHQRLVNPYNDPNARETPVIDWLRLTRMDEAVDAGDEPGDAGAALVARAKTDRAALAALFDRYAERVYRYCHRRLDDHALAEDATSQVFVRVLAGLAGFEVRANGSFAAWLFTIAHNVSTDLQRSRRDHLSLDAAADRIDERATAETAAFAADDDRSVAALLAPLPPDQRQALELRLAGLTGPEIARVLGRSHGAVKMLHHRALTTLRQRLLADHEPISRKDRP